MVYSRNRKRKRYGKYKRRSYRKRGSSKRFKYSRIARTVRRVVGGMAETKFIRLTSENLGLNHNVGLGGTAGPVVYGNLLRTDQGTNQNQRTGDSIFAKYLKLKIWISTKADRPNVMFRMMIISTPMDQVNTTGPADFWRNYNGNRILDYVNTDKYGIVWSKIVKITHGDTSFEIGIPPEGGSKLHEVSKYVNIYVPLNRKISYQTDTSGTPTPSKQRDCLSLCIIPYDAFGTLTTDTIATYASCGLFCYKDF